MTKPNSQTSLPEDNKNESAIDWQTKAEEYLNGWKRAQADYQNLQREWQTKQSSFMQAARESLLLELLPVMDNLKQAVLHTPDDIKDTNWLMGINHIETQWLKMLSDWGIEQIETADKVFDPNLHEAVGMDENFAEGVIVKEVQGGYKTNDKVLMPARVIVGSKKNN